MFSAKKSVKTEHKCRLCYGRGDIKNVSQNKPHKIPNQEKSDRQKFEDLLKEKNIEYSTERFCYCESNVQKYVCYIQVCLCCYPDSDSWKKIICCDVCIAIKCYDLNFVGHYNNFRCFKNEKDVSNKYLDSGPVTNISEIRLSKLTHSIEKLNWLNKPEIDKLILWLNNFAK